MQQQRQQKSREDFAYFGQGKVYRDLATGKFVLDTDSVRRGSGGADVGAAAHDDDPDLGAFDPFQRGSLGFGAYDAFARGDLISGDDDDDDAFLGDDDDDDADLGGKKKPKKKNKLIAKLQKQALGRAAQAANVIWGTTVISGNSDSVSTQQSVTLRIRLQHDFRAKDITFNGSTASSTITSIMFADNTLWSVPDGVDVSNFAVTGFLRDLVLGMEISKGLDIVITGVCAVTGSPAAGQIKAMLTGTKPRMPGGA